MVNKDKRIIELATDICSILRSRSMSCALAELLVDKGWKKPIQNGISIEERIAGANRQRVNAFHRESVQAIAYWDGYIAALEGILRNESEVLE